MAHPATDGAEHTRAAHAARGGERALPLGAQQLDQLEHGEQEHVGEDEPGDVEQHVGGEPRARPHDGAHAGPQARDTAHVSTPGQRAAAASTAPSTAGSARAGCTSTRSAREPLSQT